MTYPLLYFHEVGIQFVQRKLSWTVRVHEDIVGHRFSFFVDQVNPKLMANGLNKWSGLSPFPVICWISTFELPLRKIPLKRVIVMLDIMNKRM